jgi:ATP-dependent protease ClpP protease subunit
MPPKKWWNIKASADNADETVLEIFSDIGESWWSESVSARQFSEQLKAVTTSRILLKINSLGGSIFDGLTIHNALKFHPAHVVGRVEGVAASIASVILMAADEIEMPANTMLMIHDPWTVIDILMGANAEDIRKQADKLLKDAEMLDQIKQALVASYRRSSQTDKQIAALMSDETWLTAEQAVEMGFADRIAGAPAAQAAGRSAIFNSYKKIPVTARKYIMPPKDTTPEPPPKDTTPEPPPKDTTPEPPPNNVSDPNIVAAIAEKQRREEVLAVCKEMGLPDDMTAPFLADRKYTGADLRAAAAKQSPHNAPMKTGGTGVWTHGDHTDADKYRAAVGAGILASQRIKLVDSEGQPKKYAAGYEDFQHYSAIELCRIVLAKRGDSTAGMSGYQIANAALDPTGDFPLLLREVAQTVLLSGYSLKPAKRQAITIDIPARNYKENRTLRVEAEADLEILLEDGKLPQKHLKEGSESYRVKDRGMQLGVTHQVIVNDELGAVMGALNRISMRISKIEDKDVFGLIQSNPNLSDGLPLFSTANGNLATAGALSKTTLSAGRVLLAAQALITGEESEAEDTILLIGNNSDRLTAAELIFGSNLPNDTRKVLFDYLAPVWSSQITGAFYQFANPVEYPVIGFSYLQGNEAPFIETRQDFGSRSLQIAIVHSYGYGAVGHVGAVKTPAT